MKILIIGATHGDELLGPKLYERLLRQRSPLLEHIDFIIGNPRAYAARQRYVECDLNRSYGSEGAQYEVERARQIQQYIGQTAPDIVLDMHTTNCVQPNCIIVSSVEGEVRRRFLRACHIPTILQVQPMGDIATLGDNILGYEVPNRNITAELLDAIASDIRRFVGGEGGFEDKRLFTMSGKIYKKDVTSEQAAAFVNFTAHELGFVPIMTGQNSYKRQTDYLGFKSTAPEEIKV